MKPRIVIFLDGGQVTEVFSNVPVEIAKIDYQCPSIHREHIGFIQDENGNFNAACVEMIEPEVTEKGTNFYYLQVVEAVKEG